MYELTLYETTFEQCLKCHACTVNCPISSSTLDFGGPKHLGPEIRRLITNQELIDDHRIELCTLCGTCDTSCPENVHVSTLTAQAKALHAQQHGTKFRDYILSNAETIGKLASLFAPITNLTMNIRPARKAMQLVLGIEANRQFPVYKFNHFKRRFQKKQATTNRKIAYFVGCYATYNAPEVAEAFVKVMQFNRINVVIPKQKCCGVPMFANGQMKQGIKNASFNINSLLDYTRQGYDIVMTCSSCTLAFKKEYHTYLNTEEVKELAAHVYDADEYLRILHEQGELNVNFGTLNVEAGYFAPCHLKGQGIGNPAIDILELIPGFEIQDLAAGCCGQCGTFGFKEEKYQLSMQLGAEMANTVTELDADYTVTECGMCKNQLDQLTVKPVKHPIEVLLEAYDKANKGFEQD
jgi:glycerol-3-phosphate dehydrogenase subunit C